MNTSHLLILIRETNLSPEQMAKRLGISNMTVRRWMKKSPDTKIPAIYAKAVQEAVCQMAVDGVLSTGSRSYRSVLKTSRGSSFMTVIKNLGFGNDFKKAPGFSPEKLLAGLSQVGAKESQKKEVDENREKIISFNRLGSEWKQRISTLLKVLSTKRITAGDKLVAYGALFYLLCPLDLIPDNIPVFGLMDDYAVLGLASAHYLKKYKILFG